MSATTELQGGNSKMAVTVTAATKIWICGRGCGKTVATAMTTRWQSELELEVALATAMAATRNQQQ